MAIENNKDYDPVKREIGKKLRELKKTDPNKLIEYISSLSEEEANAILYDEMVWSRDKQLVDLESDYFATLYMAGRGLITGSR